MNSLAWNSFSFSRGKQLGRKIIYKQFNGGASTRQVSVLGVQCETPNEQKFNGGETGKKMIQLEIVLMLVAREAF